MATLQGSQRLNNSAKDTEALSNLNPKATLFDPGTHPEQSQGADGPTDSTCQPILQGDWNFKEIEMQREIQGTFLLAAPVVAPSSGSAQDLASSENLYHKALTPSYNTAVGNAKGDERAETTSGSKNAAKCPTPDDDRAADTEGTPSRTKRKYTKRKKMEPDTEDMAEAVEPVKKKRARPQTSTTQGNRKARHNAANMEIDATGESSQPKPLLRMRSGAISPASRGKGKVTTNEVRSDIDNVAEIDRATTGEATQSTTRKTKGRSKGKAKENTDVKTKDGKKMNVKVDAVDSEEVESVKPQKRRTKATNSKEKDRVKTVQGVEGDQNVENETGRSATTNPTRFQSSAAVFKRKGKARAANGDDSAAFMCKDKAKARDDDTNADDHALVPTYHALVPINPSDPCSLFPTELWHTVLGHLPLSLIARTSSVSKAWLAGARSYRGWAIAARNGKMGTPKIKYKTFMALVCSRSYFVCDRCLDYSTGKGLRSRIPLPVPLNFDVTNTWMLCHNCRREYYREHPERLRPPCNPTDKTTYMAHRRITKSAAMWVYWLDGCDLAMLHFNEYDNPFGARGHPMRVYDELAVQKQAYSVHAGWVGLDAAKANVAKRRRAAYKAREESNKARRMPKKEKNSKQPETPEAPFLDHQGNDGHNTDESNWEEFFDDNYGEGPSNQFGSM
ncbi:hypothetical protein BGZ59_000508 [Podila verticillata]|nr:hypothetical protein BGZ59_000508 [Podila verticillata]